MMAEIIATTKNKTYKYIKALQQKKTRNAEKKFTVEGLKSVSDAAASEYEIELIAVSEDFYGSRKADIPSGARSVIIRSDLFAALCDTKNPQGIIAVLKMKENGGCEFKKGRLYVYCDNVSDPGNLGTIIRTADAAGFGGVVLSPGCAEVYSPKTVRSSMGSFFNIDVIADFSHSSLIELKKQGFTLWSGALRADSIAYTEADFSVPSVIVIGNEANGVSEEILGESEHIIIPIYGKAESLNAAVAGAVIMYEAVRKRGGIACE